MKTQFVSQVFATVWSDRRDERVPEEPLLLWCGDTRDRVAVVGITSACPTVESRGPRDSDCIGRSEVGHVEWDALLGRTCGRRR